MDHPASLSRTHAWRTTALVAAGLAAFELLLLVMIGLALIGKPFLTSGGIGDRRDRLTASASGKRATTAAASRPAAEPKLAREETSVIVLNGNGHPGAAGEKADLVRTRGYLVAGTANATRSDFPRSIVMYRPGYRGEAERLARDFRIRRVAPLDGLRPTDLQGAHVALIVGAG